MSPNFVIVVQRYSTVECRTLNLKSSYYPFCHEWSIPEAILGATHDLHIEVMSFVVFFRPSAKNFRAREVPREKENVLSAERGWREWNASWSNSRRTRGGRRLAAAAFELCGATLKRLKSFSTAYETLTRLKQWAHRKEWTQHACARTDTREQQDDGEGKSCSAEGESATRGSARKRSSNVQREEKSWAFATWSGRPSSEDHQ